MDEIKSDWNAQDEQGTHGGDMPTDETMAYLKAEEERKVLVKEKYKTRMEEIRKHNQELRKQIELLEDNVKRNNKLLDDIHENMWEEIYL